MKTVIISALVLFAAAGMTATGAEAALVTFSGGDAGANSTDPRPVSDATAANFDAAAAALGPVQLITFESAPVGTYSSLAVAPGVTLTGTDYTGNAAGQSILNSPYGSPDNLFGYNTTPGGQNFAFVNGGFITFSFATPIQAFGAYISGVQLDNETLMFSDGTSQSVTFPNLGGGVDFVGFTDAGKLISSVVVNSTSAASSLGDFISVDDVRYVSAAVSVPEPLSLALLVTGLSGLGLTRRRSR